MAHFWVTPPSESLEPATREWYAVQVENSRVLDPVLASLREKGYEAFTPFRTVSLKGRRGKVVSRAPVFPGYIFTRLDIRFRMPVLTTPGVRCLVGYGRCPVPLNPDEILAIRRAARTELPVEEHPYPGEGQVVRLVQGPLTGITGILVGNEGESRVVLRVTLLQRALAVTVNSDWVRLVATA
jgi:transcriptional antiterminator RfaH